jgi:superfamily II helicase
MVEMASVISIFKSNNLAYMSKLQNDDTKEQKLAAFQKLAMSSSGIRKAHFENMLNNTVDVDSIYFDGENVATQAVEEIIKQTLKLTGFIVLSHH